MPPHVHTIGYTGHTPDGFLAALQGAGVQTLVDVRELPLSRKRGFSKGPLSASLEAHGIRYVHLRALGAPRGARHALREGGPWPAFRAAYLRHLDGAETQAALEELRRLAHQERVAVMCMEQVAADCHRSLLLERMGLPWSDLTEAAEAPAPAARRARRGHG